MVLAAIASDAKELDVIQNHLSVIGVDKFTAEIVSTVEVERSKVPMLDMAEVALGMKVIPSQTGLLRVWNVKFTE